MALVELKYKDRLGRRNVSEEIPVVLEYAGSDAQSGATIEPAVARFFKEVFVMTDDVALRQARLRLMKRLEQVILQLGDISEIVATES